VSGLLGVVDEPEREPGHCQEANRGKGAFSVPLLCAVYTHLPNVLGVSLGGYGSSTVPDVINTQNITNSFLSFF
jgi:hypothetical protein